MQRIRIHLVLVFIKIISFHYFIYGERSLYLSPYYSLVAENGKEIPTPNILDSIWTTIVETDIEPADKDPNVENYNSSHNNEFEQRKNAKRFMSFHLYIFLSNYVQFGCIYLFLPQKLIYCTFFFEVFFKNKYLRIEINFCFIFQNNFFMILIWHFSLSFHILISLIDFIYS